MALQVSYQRVFGVPVSPDAISSGAISLVNYPAITGDFITNINVNLRTYTFDLRGINEELATTIAGYCDTNAEELAKGNIDFNNPSGQGSFTYRDVICIPIGYQDGGTLNIANTTNNFSSFQVTCLTNKVSASI